MYSGELQKLLQRSKIETGDRIRVDSVRLQVEGELMPKTEVSGEDILIIKLDNGYNIGIAYNDQCVIRKISSGTKSTSFPVADIKTTKGLPKVSLIYTGGTIGSKIDYKTGGVYMLIKPEELLYEVPELSGIANLDVKTLFSIASEDMSYSDWQKIAEEVKRAIEGGARGVVITMGTDIMHYTAAALSFMLRNLNVPIVITGAQRSSDRGSSDAFLNLAAAVQVAANSDIAEVGICMHNSSSDDRCVFIRGTRARKMHTSRRDAFRSVNDRPIAYIDRKLNITYVNNNYNKRVDELDEQISFRKGFEQKVALVKFHPNSDPEVLDFYLRKGYRGIIIEGTGLGHVAVTNLGRNMPWLEHIKRLVESGVVVGMTSQCIYGRVNRNVYRNLRLVSNLGVVYCEDMLPEVAYVKLGWLLGNYSSEDAKMLLDKSAAREIKSRSEYDEFLI